MMSLDYTGNKELEKVRDFLADMEEPIIRDLKERSRYFLNEKIYSPGAIKIEGHDESFFDYLFKGVQELQSKANRFIQAGEVPFYDNLPGPIMDRKETHYLLGDTEININDDLLLNYMANLGFLCEPGDDEFQYGSSAMADIFLLGNLSTRVNRGGVDVADAKYKQYPKEFHDVVSVGGPGSKAALMHMLTVYPKEVEVRGRVRKKAKIIGFDNPDKVVDTFKWIITLTKKVQVKRVIEIDEKGLLEKALR
jgi:chorismate mutase